MKRFLTFFITVVIIFIALLGALVVARNRRNSDEVNYNEVTEQVEIDTEIDASNNTDESLDEVIGDISKSLEDLDLESNFESFDDL